MEEISCMGFAIKIGPVTRIQGNQQPVTVSLSEVLLSNGELRSKKQKTIALSTAEAKYKAATAAVGEALWLRRILEDGGQP